MKGIRCNLHSIKKKKKWLTRPKQNAVTNSSKKKNFKKNIFQMTMKKSILYYHTQRRNVRFLLFGRPPRGKYPVHLPNVHPTPQYLKQQNNRIKNTEK